MRGLLTVICIAAVGGCAEKANPSGGPSACEAVCTPGARTCGDAGILLCGDFDGDGCPELGEPIHCPAGAACREGECVAACVSTCAEGEAECVGKDLRRCNETPDGCRALGPPERCGDGFRCDNGACVGEDTPCADACETDGQRSCFGEGFRRCGQFDEDACLEWSATLSCQPGELCTGGTCVPSCQDACQGGETRCADGGTQTCGQFDADSCLEFGPTSACDPGLRCDDGLCVDEASPCVDTCDADGDARCAGANGLQQCGQFDEDACLELSPIIDCGPGAECHFGTCVATCDDVCEPAALRCGGGTTVERCVREDGPCLSWGDRVECGAGTACGGGVCAEVGAPCEDRCDADATRCGAGGVETCGDTDGDGCREWAETVACSAGDRCESGRCVTPPPPAGALVINELFYDAEGGDGPTVFVEIHGPAGTSLEGHRLVGINGNNGEEYGAIPLVGAIPADGLFVVATPGAAPALQAVADQLHANADYQNGPDSVQLKRDEVVVDALAYGDAGPHNAGEGVPAEDVSGQSLSRSAAHADSGDNAADFTASSPTPGQ